MEKSIMVKLITMTILSLFLTNNVYAEESILESAEQELKLDNFLNTLNEYTEGDIDLEDTAKNLIKGKGIDYGIIGKKIINVFTGQISSILKGVISISIVIVLIAILKSLELENDSSVSKVAYLVSFLVITIILITTYKDVTEIFINSINVMTKIVQAVAPFLMAILMATGLIVTTGIIQPLMLLITSLTGIIINYVIIPLLTVSLVLNVISGMSEVINLNKLSELISKISMWIVGIIFAVMVGIISLESNIGTSVDNVTVKTAQAAISGTIPVVGKFMSDSLEVIMGSAEVIGKTAGIIGILLLIIVMVPPVIKIIVIIIAYSILIAFTEGIGADKKVNSLLASFNGLYKTLFGILIGVMSIFIISIGIIMSLMGKVTS